MDCFHVLRQVCGALDSTEFRYALIAGITIAMRGVQRATIDLGCIRRNTPGLLFAPVPARKHPGSFTNPDCTYAAA